MLHTSQGNVLTFRYIGCSLKWKYLLEVTFGIGLNSVIRRRPLSSLIIKNQNWFALGGQVACEVNYSTRTQSCNSHWTTTGRFSRYFIPPDGARLSLSLCAPVKLDNFCDAWSETKIGLGKEQKKILPAGWVTEIGRNTKEASTPVSVNELWRSSFGCKAAALCSTG